MNDETFHANSAEFLEKWNAVFLLIMQEAEGSDALSSGLRGLLGCAPTFLSANNGKWFLNERTVPDPEENRSRIRHWAGRCLSVMDEIQTAAAAGSVEHESVKTALAACRWIRSNPSALTGTPAPTLQSLRAELDRFTKTKQDSINDEQQPAL